MTLIFSALVVAWGVFSVIAGPAVSAEGARPTAVLTSRVANDGDFFTLPVKIDDEWHAFAVDTGTPRTMLDARFRNRLTPAESAKANIDEDREAPTFYVPPQMVVTGTEAGAVPFRANQPVACVDLLPLRESSSLHFEGILGMDFLKSYALEIDAVEGRLRLLDPTTLGGIASDAQLPMAMRQQRPLVRVQSHDANYWTIVATGALISHVIEHDVYQYLLRQDQLRRREFEVDVDGEKRIAISDVGYLRELKLGPYSHRSLVVFPGEDSRLGLYYWRRYRCIFDFPGRTVYLQMGRDFHLRDDTGHAGIYFDEVADPDGGLRIRHVTIGSEGQYYGVREGDRLLSIDNSSVARDSIDHIRRRLSFRNGPRRLVLDRNGTEIQVTIPATEIQPEP